MGGECAKSIYNQIIRIEVNMVEISSHTGGLRGHLVVANQLIGVDHVSFEQNFHHSLVAVPSGTPEWCSAVVIGIVWVDITPFKYYFHHSFVATPSGTPKRCLAVIIRLVGINLVPLEYRKNPLYPLSRIGAWQLHKGMCAMVPRERVTGRDAEISPIQTSVIPLKLRTATHTRCLVA